MKRIFFVEDDRNLGDGLVFALQKQGYEPVLARTCREAEQKWTGGEYDLVILDVSLPDGSGYDLCRRIRQNSRVPIVFLTAADQEIDIIRGLEVGGDDYITKPFKLAVFLAKIQALLRRSAPAGLQKTELCSGGVTVQLLRREVRRDGQLVELTASEYKLLCLLMEHPDMVLSPEQILGRLWDWEDKYPDPNTLTVYIRRLRTKMEEDPAHPRRILTVRGMGYRWNSKEEGAL